MPQKHEKTQIIPCLRGNKASCRNPVAFAGPPGVANKRLKVLKNSL